MEPSILSEVKMFDQILPAIVALLVLGLIWGMLKLVLKLTAKIFTCGCLTIVVIGALIFVASNYGNF